MSEARHGTRLNTRAREARQAEGERDLEGETYLRAHRKAVVALREHVHLHTLTLPYAQESINRCERVT
jgi:hypothetical protein